jgi:hypothetical protein
MEASTSSNPMGLHGLIQGWFFLGGGVTLSLLFWWRLSIRLLHYTSDSEAGCFTHKLRNGKHYGNSNNISNSRRKCCEPHGEVTFILQYKLLWDSGIFRKSRSKGCFHVKRERIFEMTGFKHGNELGWHGTSQKLHMHVLIGSKWKCCYAAK